MFDQATVNRLSDFDLSGTPSIHHMDSEGGSVRRLMADIAELAELQGRLVASDVKCLTASTIRPAIYSVMALMLALGALPVLLLSVASFLADSLNWSAAFAQLTIGGVVILIALSLCLFAFRGLSKCGAPMSRSVAEFEKNMDTLREMLSGHSRLEAHLGQLDRRDRA